MTDPPALRQLFPDGGPPAEEAPATIEVLPAPSAPLDVARALMRDLTDSDGHLLLRKWRGDFMRYVGPHWAPADPDGMRKWLYERLGDVQYEQRNPKTEQTELKPWNPDSGKVDKVLDAMVAPTLLDRSVNAPSWLSTGESAAGVVPCLNGLVDVATQEITPASPDYFGTTAIPIEFDPHAGAPAEWLRFLRTLWPPVEVDHDPDDCTVYPGRCNGWHDADEIRTLRQWFGYVLSGRRHLQKMLLLKGPPRCGKGTIARTLIALVGEANVAAPTLAGVATQFGLETSIGKTLMVVGDARLATHGQETALERLLSISGEDEITLDRKNRQAWTGTMQARVMILSNDTPKFLDASGAIASRFVILRFEKEFLGREDTDLSDRIAAELPAILKWALEGYRDLATVRRLTAPASHTEAMQEMYDLVSPIKAFLRDVCADGGAAVPFSELYTEYQAWCSENGRSPKNTAGFSADLAGAKPGLKTDYRPRTADGRKMPRHVLGVAISKEWESRVREGPNWKTV